MVTDMPPPRSFFTRPSLRRRQSSLAPAPEMSYCLHKCLDGSEFGFLLRPSSIRILHGLTARIPGFHPGGPGSTPGVGNIIFSFSSLLSILGLQQE